MKRSNTVLSFAQLKDGYVKTVENALRFFDVSVDLLANFPDKALALGQLGQEEVGRSLTLLAAFRLQANTNAWKWFWQGWNNHELKAHRAYLYEAISPLRLEATTRNGNRFAGEPLRPKIAQEKEAGLYVDFDHTQGRFVSPVQQVSSFEAAARTMTLAYLCLTADAVRRAIFIDDETFRLNNFSELAFRICTEDLYQQDMPSLLEEFRKRTPRHQALISDLETALTANANLLHGLRTSGQADTPHLPFNH